MLQIITFGNRMPKFTGHTTNKIEYTITVNFKTLSETNEMRYNNDKL